MSLLTCGRGCRASRYAWRHSAAPHSKAAAWLGKALYYLLPNLAPFDVKAAVVHGHPVPAAYVALTTGYGLLYAGVMVTLAVLIFSRRDFK